MPFTEVTALPEQQQLLTARPTPIIFAVRSNWPVIGSYLCAGSVEQSSSLLKLWLHPLLFKTQENAEFNEQRWWKNSHTKDILLESNEMFTGIILLLVYFLRGWCLRFRTEILTNKFPLFCFDDFWHYKSVSKPVLILVENSPLKLHLITV